METGINVTLTLDKLVKAAQYFGSLVDNTKEAYDNLDWFDERTKPTWEQIQSEWLILNVELKKDNCKQEAKRRIAEYDWVIDTETTPDLLNREDFIAYRSELRQLILNPVENPVWPEIPQEEWA